MVGNHKDSPHLGLQPSWLTTWAAFFQWQFKWNAVQFWWMPTYSIVHNMIHIPYKKIQWKYHSSWVLNLKNKNKKHILGCWTEEAKKKHAGLRLFKSWAQAYGRVRSCSQKQWCSSQNPLFPVACYGMAWGLRKQLGLRVHFANPHSSENVLHRTSKNRLQTEDPTVHRKEHQQSASQVRFFVLGKDRLIGCGLVLTVDLLHFGPDELAAHPRLASWRIPRCKGVWQSHTQWQSMTLLV